MTKEKFRRKLSVILSADAVSYSRLMSDNEIATVKTLEAYREIMSTLIIQYRGRVIDSPGDNLLAEFSSVVDAVQCAVALQKEFQARNLELHESRRMEFRIGVNLGDVIEKGERIYGDGVNIAARLEALSDPGGICVSKTAFDQIENKLPLGYEYLGEQKVKNISKPIDVYRVLMDPRVSTAKKLEKDKFSTKRLISIFATIATLFLLVVAIIIWQFFKTRPAVDSTSVENKARGGANTHDELDIDKNATSSSKGESLKDQFMSEETQKREPVDIARLEKELDEIEFKIAALNKESASSNISENDDLSAMLLMVKEREEKQKQLNKLRERWQKEEQKRLEEISRLKNERKKAQRQAIENDIDAYEKIVSSPYGKDLKDRAWKKLVDRYPEANDLEIGNVDVLRMILYKEWVEPNSGIEFVWVAGGCFQMGDTFGDGDNDEKPVHEVCVNSFVLSRYEVTQGQWKKLMGYNPSKFAKGDNYPVEQVSWDETQNFIRKLNSKSNKFFRLPTEAEWEYAARSGGKKEKYSGGDDIDILAWYKNNSGRSTHPVGTKKPNGLGLYDMSGNVWEWCSDRYSKCYYQQSPRNNPKGESVGPYRVIRDGGWNGSAWLCRPANRDRFMPGNRLDNLGFRLVFAVK